MALKLFAVGLPKSGTSTLHKALQSAGLKSLHWRSPEKVLIGRAMYLRHMAGEPIMADFPNANAVTQADGITMNTSYWPQMDPAILRALRKQHPECQFVLNRRDPLLIASSIQRWGNLMERLFTVGAPGLPPRTATGAAALVRWIEGHYANIAEQFAGDPNFFDYDISDPTAPETIAARIAVPLPEWGQENVNDGTGRLGVVTLKEGE